MHQIGGGITYFDDVTGDKRYAQVPQNTSAEHFGGGGPLV